MLSSRLHTVSLAAALVAGIALWLSFGVLAVRETDNARIGLLPSLPLLALSIAAALAATAALRLLPRPALSLFSSILVILPWLPLPVPTLFLVWTGPAALFAWTGIALCVAASWANNDAQTGRLRVFLRSVGLHTSMDGRRAPLAASVLAFIMFIGLRLGTVGPPGGDEPHYLLIAQSILQDRDIKVENNYERRDYLPYWGGFLLPHYAKRSLSGELYSVHAPGVPALIAPALRVAGYWGVVAWIAAFVAIGSAFVWKAGYTLTRNAGAAWFGWASVALTAPVALHGTLIYPDPIGGALLAAGTHALVVARNTTSEPNAASASRWNLLAWLMTGAAVGVLPWMHTRLALPAACLGGALLLRLGTLTSRGQVRWQLLAVFTAPALISAAGWFVFFRLLYGTFDPSSAYGDQLTLDATRAGIGLAGLLADQEFGLLPNAPVHLLWAAGFWSMFRRDARLGAELLLMVGPYVAAASAFPMWYAGAAPPGRFLVPIVFPAGIAIAALWASQGASQRAMSLGLLALSMLVAVTLAVGGDGTFAYNRTDGRAKWLDWIAPVVDLPASLPSFFRGGGGLTPPMRAVVEYLLVPEMLWTLALLTGFVLFRRLAARLPSPFIPPLVFGCVTFVLALGASATWLFAGGNRFASTRSQLRLLEADDPSWRPVGIRLPRLSVFPSGQARARLMLFSSPLESTEPGSLLSLANVPPGDYMLRVTRRSPTMGDIGIRVGRGSGVAWQWPAPEEARDTPPFHLPITASSLVVQGYAGVAESIERVALVPAPRSEELVRSNACARDAARYGQVIAFALDNRVVFDPSGFWVLGWRQPEVVFLVDPGVNDLNLEIRNVSLPNRIRVWTGQWSMERSLAPDELWRVQVPITGLGRSFPIGFKVERGLSVTEGQLGCRVEIRSAP